MPHRTSITDDPNEAAFRGVQDLIEQSEGKNPAAVALGRLGGIKGGKTRAEKLSARKRSAIAKKGAQLARDAAGTRPRHRHIRARSRVGKRKGHVASGDRRRRKGETTFHRDKASLGSARRARGLASQRVEVRWGCTILNTMPARGIPDGEMIG